MNDKVSLREVWESDLETFFTDQLDPEAVRMAAFPSRDREAFMVIWQKIMTDTSVTARAVLFEGELAGHVVSWEQGGERKIGYWLGKACWGKGVASAALSQFLAQFRVRPLVAEVAQHNVASIRVLRKCGFTVSREARTLLDNGESVEDYVMTLSAEAAVDEPS